MTRICITGGPKTGKTTLARNLSAFESLQHDRNAFSSLRHTDDLIALGWSEASEAASRWLDEPGPWIVEGVAVSRALRKWRKAHPDDAPPCDRVIHLTVVYGTLTAGQATMAKGVDTVTAELVDWFRDHGVPIERR